MRPCQRSMWHETSIKMQTKSMTTSQKKTHGKKHRRKRERRIIETFALTARDRQRTWLWILQLSLLPVTAARLIKQHSGGRRQGNLKMTTMNHLLSKLMEIPYRILRLRRSRSRWRITTFSYKIQTSISHCFRTHCINRAKQIWTGDIIRMYRWISQIWLTGKTFTSKWFRTINLTRTDPYFQEVKWRTLDWKSKIWMRTSFFTSHIPGDQIWSKRLFLFTQVSVISTSRSRRWCTYSFRIHINKNRMARWLV